MDSTLEPGISANQDPQPIPRCFHGRSRDCSTSSIVSSVASNNSFEATVQTRVADHLLRRASMHLYPILPWTELSCCDASKASALRAILLEADLWSTNESVSP